MGKDSRLPHEFDLTGVVEPGRTVRARAHRRAVVGRDLPRGPGSLVPRRPAPQRVPVRDAAGVHRRRARHRRLRTRDRRRPARRARRGRRATARPRRAGRARVAIGGQRAEGRGVLRAPELDRATSFASRGAGADAVVDAARRRAVDRRDAEPARSHRHAARRRTASRSTSCRSRSGSAASRCAGHELLVNGRPVLIKGVNRHDHDPRRGKAVTARVDRGRRRADEAAQHQRDPHVALPERRLPLRRVRPARHVRGRRGQHRDPRLPAQPHQGPDVDAARCSSASRAWRSATRTTRRSSCGRSATRAARRRSHVAAAAWLRAWDPTRPVHYEGGLGEDLIATRRARRRRELRASRGPRPT